MFETKISVAGVTFKNSDGTHRQDVLGTLYDDYWTEDREDEVEIELRHDRKNRYDSNAVAIHVTAPKEAVGQIGFVPADQAEYVGQQLSLERIARVEVADMGCIRGNKIWAKLTIQMRGEEDPLNGKPVSSIEDENGRRYEFD